MPTARVVPQAPRMSYLYRRIARLPAGGASGFACAAAGIACALGIAFVGPNLDVPQIFERLQDRPPGAAVLPDAPVRRNAQESTSSTADRAQIRVKAKSSASHGSKSGLDAPKPVASSNVVPEASPAPATQVSQPTTPVQPPSEDPVLGGGSRTSADGGDGRDKEPDRADAHDGRYQRRTVDDQRQDDRPGEEASHYGDDGPGTGESTQRS